MNYANNIIIDFDKESQSLIGNVIRIWKDTTRNQKHRLNPS